MGGIEPKIRFRIQGNELQFKVEFTGADGKKHLKFETIRVTDTMGIEVLESMIDYLRHPLYLKNIKNENS